MPLNFVPGRYIVNKSAPVQVMAWCLTDAKSLPGSMLTKMCEAISKCVKPYGVTKPQRVIRKLYTVTTG